jgi:hypothetical protein
MLVWPPVPVALVRLPVASHVRLAVLPLTVALDRVPSEL